MRAHRPTGQLADAIDSRVIGKTGCGSNPSVGVVPFGRDPIDFIVYKNPAPAPGIGDKVLLPLSS
jgi:hypothetical protein